MKRIDADFFSRGLKCAGWLFLPEDAPKPPVVLMAHGFGAERTFRLPAFAEKFCGHGLAAFVFDYRNFGDSEGEPRNLISPKRHLEDWQAALEHVQKLPEVDGRRVALWGSSFSGGHVLVMAAQTPGIRAVVAQVPFVDGLATSLLYSWPFIFKATGHALVDVLKSLFFLPPHNVPIVGEPDQFALMNTPECMPGVLSILPANYVLKNFAPARIALTLPFYRPIKSVSRINCPVLLLIAEKDSLIPPQAVRKTAALIKNSRTINLSAGHFEVYTGELFEKMSRLQAEFLKEHLNRAS